MLCYLQPRIADALRDNFILETDNDEPNTMTGFFMPARRVLREIVCRIAGANQQNSRSVTAGKGSNLWAMHESSRFNMSFKCSGEFNIIYIMRTNLVEAQC